MPVERVPAVICDIKHLKEGRYVERPGWDPNYVVLNDRVRVSRVNIIGAITLATAEGGSAQYTLSDGTGEITLRTYDTSELEANPGELVIVIGRPRSYQNEVYIVPEIIRLVKEPWATHRKKHLEILTQERSVLPILEEEPQDTSETSTPREREPVREAPQPPAQAEPANDTERIYAMIETLDGGDGVDISDVLTKAESDGIENAEKAIHHMLEMGDIFEIRAGKLKVL